MSDERGNNEPRITHNPDGLTKSIFPDGTVIRNNPGGTRRIDELPDQRESGKEPEREEE